MEFSKDDVKGWIRDALGEVVAPLKGMEERLTAKFSKSEPKADLIKAQAAEEPKEDPNNKRIQDMEAQLLRASYDRHLPENIHPDRAGLAYDVLMQRGKILQRDGASVIRLDRNGQTVDVPLAEGLKEWAGTKEADAFCQPNTGGSGAQGGLPETGTGAGQKVPAIQVLNDLFNQKTSDE